MPLSSDQLVALNHAETLVDALNTSSRAAQIDAAQAAVTAAVEVLHPDPPGGVIPATAEQLQGWLLQVQAAIEQAQPQPDPIPDPTPTPDPDPTPTPPDPTPPPTGTAVRFFSASSPWNTRKVSPVFEPDADAVLSSMDWGLNNAAYAHPVIFAAADDPLVTFRLKASWGQPDSTVQVHCPTSFAAASGTDGSAALVLPDGRILDMWQITGNASSGYAAQAYGWADSINGTGFSDEMWHTVGIDAIGCSEAGGTILARDIQAGVINHGLCVALDPQWLGDGITGNGQYWVSPAQGYDAGGNGPLPQGALLLIPPDAAVPAGLSANGMMLWAAAKTYGAIVVDKTGGWAEFYGDRSATVDQAFTGSDLSLVGRALRWARSYDQEPDGL